MKADCTPTDLRGQYAGFASRLVAFLIDRSVIALVIFVATWAAISLLGYLGIDITDCDSHPPVKARVCEFLLIAGPLAATAFLFLYDLFFWATSGQSPGKAVMGVRVVRVSGEPMGLLTAARRVVGYALSLGTLGLGFLVILSDDRRQGWHDKLAGTCVIYSWKARESRRVVERVRQVFRGAART